MKDALKTTTRRDLMRFGAATLSTSFLGQHAVAQPLGAVVADIGPNNAVQIIAGNGAAVNHVPINILDLIQANAAQMLTDTRPTNYFFWTDPNNRHGVWRDIVGATFKRTAAATAAMVLAPKKFSALTNITLTNTGTPTAQLALLTGAGSFMLATITFGLQYALTSYIMKRWPHLSENIAKWISFSILGLTETSLVIAGTRLLVDRVAQSFNPTQEGELRRRLLSWGTPLDDAKVNNYGDELTNLLWVVENLRFGTDNKVLINLGAFPQKTTEIITLPTVSIESLTGTVNLPRIKTYIATGGQDRTYLPIKLNPWLRRPVKLVSDQNGYQYVLSGRNSLGFNIYSAPRWDGSNTTPTWRKLTGQAVDIAAGSSHMWCINSLGSVYMAPLAGAYGTGAWAKVPSPMIPSTNTPEKAIAVAIGHGYPLTSNTSTKGGPIGAWIKTASNRYYATVQNLVSNWALIPALKVPPRILGMLNEAGDTSSAMNDAAFIESYTSNAR